MTFNFLAQKRITKDIKNYIQSDINSVGIYCHIDDFNMKHIQALSIGPPNTPYENGFYFFNIDFPNDYPFSPPKVKFLTYDYGIRFNPNLYTNGKVCLSILGTWSGPGWSTCLNLNTILLSIQSLLNDNPLTNEPGFEKESGVKSKNYSSIIAYSNIKTATIKMLETPPAGFEVFKDVMGNHFVKNIDFYNNYIIKNKSIHQTHLNSSIYSMSILCDIDYLNSRIDFLYNKYKETSSTSATATATAAATATATATATAATAATATATAATIKVKKQRKSPNDVAKNYEIGYTKLSENDNKMYKVVQVSGPKRTMKRWVLAN